MRSVEEQEGLLPSTLQYKGSPRTDATRFIKNVAIRVWIPLVALLLGFLLGLLIHGKAEIRRCIEHTSSYCKRWP